MGRSFLNSATNRILGGVLAFASGSNARGSEPINTDRIPYDTYRYDELPTQKPYAGVRPSNMMRPQMQSPTKYWYENSLVANPNVYSIMNTYRYTFDGITTLADDRREYDGAGNEKQIGGIEWGAGTLSPSLFNPYYGIQKVGATKNTPLLDTEIGSNFSKDFTDCSISTLCKLSSNQASELGAARYKYSDFMYCKDLGMPNNRMITLRRFSMPVGDMIFGPASTMGADTYTTPGDIGHLVGYFDTEDNKLEDILQYSFFATWEERRGEIEQQASKEDNRVSPLGATLNTLSSQYRDAMNKGLAGGNSALDYVFGATQKWYDPGEVLVNYDKNKVYDPIDVVRRTHLYTGELMFNHEFTLTFNYTLRSYDNINPKSAMLDLIANATAVCYKRGHFWGGRQEILGAQPNIAGWAKANAITEQAWAKLGGVFQSLGEGGETTKAAIANLANYMQNTIKSVTGTDNAENMGVTDYVKKMYKMATNPNGTLVNAGLDYMKAKMQNWLGRPQMYLFNSILTGDNVGLWHVTIGNPRNPIAVMGNLIVTDAKIQHYGPLGQDDFPTGLKVIVTLKHARPRDSVSIQKMYTRGIMAIYQQMNDKSAGFWNSSPAGIMYAGEHDTEKLRRNMEEIR